jgi:hypothetical protein
MALVGLPDIGFTGYPRQLGFTTSTTILRTSILLLSPFKSLMYRNHFYNSKAGHAYLAQKEAEAAEKAKH